MQDEKLAFAELVIKNVDVRTHFGDPTQKYTKERIRKWKDGATGSETEYIQAATTRQQKVTKRTQASLDQQAVLAGATTDAFSYAAQGYS